MVTKRYSKTKKILCKIKIMNNGTEAELERVGNVLQLVLEKKWKVKLEKWDIL